MVLIAIVLSIFGIITVIKSGNRKETDDQKSIPLVRETTWDLASTFPDIDHSHADYRSGGRCFGRGDTKIISGRTLSQSPGRPMTTPSQNRTSLKPGG